MNTTSLKTFAQDARNKLRVQVAARLNYWLGAEGGTAPDTAAHRQFAPQIKELAEALKKEGRDGLVERISYTWFNRLVALRFMDANDFHPFGVRVVTPASGNEILPALLQQARSGALNPEIRAKLANPQSFDDILAGRIPVAHQETELFGMLLLAACNYYHSGMPFLFEKLGDATQLLLPEDLLSEQSILTDIRENLTDEDCAEVEVIGWLYQFYISEKKDEVMGRKKAVPTEDIPAVTQLFTPHWIVRYLVENSLGRLWLLNRPHSRLREHMPYYIEDSAPEPVPYQAEWETHIPMHGDGDFRTFLWLRPNPDLRDEPEVIMHYALTIDGYAYAREIWGIPDASSGGAADKLRSLIQNGKITGSFEDLRAALFLWQRATKWDGDRDYTKVPHFALCYDAVCEAWQKEWRNNEPLLPDLATHGIRLPETAQTDFLKITRPEDIKLVDPAVGSGHMLTYAFDLLYRIYEEEGYDAPEIPSLILKHNLHGLEICDRAAALAAFALCMKARAKDRRFFKRLAEGVDQTPRPHIIELQDVRFAESELRDYVSALKLSNIFQHTILKLLYQFEEAKNFGSLIQPCETEAAILEVRRIVSDRWSEITDQSPSLFLRETHNKVLRVLEQAEALTQRYHVLVANPPYMTGGMNGQISALVNEKFSDSSSDLSATFISRSRQFCLPMGICGLVTMHSWMFLPTLVKFRKDLISSCQIFNLAHHGIGAFPTLNSKVVQTVAFTFCASPPKANSVPVCFRLLDYDPAVKERQLLTREKRFANVRQNDFSRIEGWPLAYWLSESIIASFQQSPIRSRYTLKEGLGTRNDPHFLRYFWEVSLNRTRTGKEVEAKWIRTDKAGAARKWYGNYCYVMNWENDGFEIKNYRNPDGTLKSRPQNTQFFFREAVSWGKVGTILKTFRLRDSDLAFNDAAPSAFGENLSYLLALLNSKVFESLLEIQGDTMNVTLGVVGILPFIAIDRENQHIVTTSQECVTLARVDWNNFEISWDFQDQPLLRPKLKGSTLEASWQNWENQSTAATRRMQELETDNNRLFISAYSLDSELHPEVAEGQITLARADARRDTAAFISYAVGCMMGRYSLDQPGLILANASATFEDYIEMVPNPTFVPDEDGILPVLDGEWFTDDIVGRFREFLRVTFGEESFAANLRFIEESLGKPEAKTGKIKPTEIRSYFAGEFYKNHLSTERAYGYKKRPIYWMVSSPNGSFQALIYLHRYTRDTMNNLLDRYVRAFLDKLEQRQQACTVISTDDSAKPAARTAAQKELLKLGKMLKEIREWERDTLLPIAQKRIELDLDDGVKLNYLKFKGVLVPIAGLEKKEDD